MTSGAPGAEAAGVAGASSTWSTNTKAEKVAERLRAARRVALLTHARPDGDAVGSTLALARALRRIGVEATPVYTGPWSHRFDQVVGDTPIAHVGAGEQIAGKIGGEPDAIAVLDTGSWSQLHEVQPWLATRGAKTIVIDHHLHGDGEVGAMRVIDTGAAAACQPVAALCCALLGASDAGALPADVAEPLFLGLATDTGWFRHANVTPAVLALAAKLLEAGANHARLYEAVEQSDKPSRLCLMARALASLELHGDGRFAVLTLTRRDLEECAGELDDAGGFSDLAMALATVRVAAMLVELAEGVTKVSLRSKPARSGEDQDDFVDVNAVAMPLGGGGHAQASGVKIKAPVDEARRRIVAALLETDR